MSISIICVKRKIEVLTKNFKKVRDRGANWFFTRLKFGLLESNLFPLNVIKYIHRKTTVLFRNLSEMRCASPNALTVVWDLRNQPVNFNVCEYLCLLEFVMKEKKKTEMAIVVLKSTMDTSALKYGYRSVIGEEARLWQIENIMIPIMRMHPLIKSIYFVDSPNEVEHYRSRDSFYPHDWSSLHSPKFDLHNYYKLATERESFQGLKPSVQAVNYVRTMFRDLNTEAKVVTLTIRDYGYDPARNSNKEAWSSFLTYLVGRNYWPVVIPDTENPDGCDDFFPRVYIRKEFCWNLFLRFALYNVSFLNLGNPNGPAAMMQFSKDCKFLIMNMGAAGSEVNTPEVFAKVDIKLGDQFKFFTRGQRISWCTDSLENLICEFESLECSLKSGIVGR